MHTLLAFVVGVLFAAGVYLTLQRSLLRLIFGVVMLSNAANLLIITAGRASRANPALVPEGAAAVVEPVVNPLPQALILTAVVIGFALISFALILVQRGYEVLGTMDPDRIQAGSGVEVTDHRGRTPKDREEAA